MIDTSELALTFIQSLKEWFRWRANPRSRNTTTAVTKKDLKSIYQKTRTRGQKSYEIFAKLYRDTVDPIVEEACRVQGITGKAKLPVWHKTASTLWKKASHDQVEAVKAEMGREKDQEDSDDEGKDQSSPESYQQCVHSFLLIPSR